VEQYHDKVNNKKHALSSTEVDYIASASSTRKMIWIKQLMKEIGFHQLGPPLLHCDNQLCVTLTKNPCHDNRSKHIDIKTSLSS
jgi:hypothetical protein